MKSRNSKFALAYCLSLITICTTSQTAFAQLGTSDWQGGGGGSSSGGGLQSRQPQMDSSSDSSFYSTSQNNRAQGSSMNSLQAQMGGLGQSNWINGGGQSQQFQQQQQPAANEATWYQPAGTGPGPDETELSGSVQQSQQFQQAPQQQYQQQQYQQPQQFQQQQFAQQQPQQFQQQPQQFQQQQYPQQQQMQQFQQQQPRQISSSDWQQGGSGGSGMAFGEQGEGTPDGIDPKALAQMQKAAQAMGSGKNISGQAQQFLNSGAPQQQMQQQARFRGGFAVPQRAMRPMQGGGGMGNPMGGLGTTMNRALNRSVQSAIYKGVNQGLFRGLSKMRF